MMTGRVLILMKPYAITGHDLITHKSLSCHCDGGFSIESTLVSINIASVLLKDSAQVLTWAAYERLVRLEESFVQEVENGSV